MVYYRVIVSLINSLYLLVLNRFKSKFTVMWENTSVVTRPMDTYVQSCFEKSMCCSADNKFGQYTRLIECSKQEAVNRVLYVCHEDAETWYCSAESASAWRLGSKSFTTCSDVQCVATPVEGGGWVSGRLPPATMTQFLNNDKFWTSMFRGTFG